MAIVWRDKVLSSYNGNLESVVVHNNAGDTEVEVPNGVFVTLHGQMEGEREVKKAHLTSAEDLADRKILLVNAPEVMYDEKKEIDEFINEAGDVVRAFRLADGDVITLTEDLLPDGLAVEDELAVGADGRLEAVAGDATEAPAVKFVVREDAAHQLTKKQKAWRFDIVID